MCRWTVQILIVCLSLVAFAAGQSMPLSQRQSEAKTPIIRAPHQSPSNLHLVRVETVEVPSIIASSFYPPFKCDADGNIYLQNDPRAPAVQKFSPKGEATALFRPLPNTNNEIDAAGSFAVTPAGDVFQLVFPHEVNRYVFTYKPDGSFKSAIKLDPGFTWWQPNALAVFGSGQMLVSGSEFDEDHNAARWPFTGIFSTDGSLLREVKLDVLYCTDYRDRNAPRVRAGA